MFHFSDNPNIQQFHPRYSPAYPDLPPVVWAIEEAKAPLYLFPRDCPRVAFWARPDTSQKDRNDFLGLTTAQMVIAVESAWLEQIQSATLYRYTVPKDSFHLFDAGAGYYISEETIVPERTDVIRNLFEHLAVAKVELRITPSLVPLRDALPTSSMQFSMIRMRNCTSCSTSN